MTVAQDLEAARAALVIIDPAPYNAEAPPAALVGEITPTELHSVRSNFRFLLNGRSEGVDFRGKFVDNLKFPGKWFSIDFAAEIAHFVEREGGCQQRPSFGTLNEYKR